VSGADVAVLQLATPVSDVAPLRVATAADAALVRPGTPVVTLSWGATRTAGTAPGLRGAVTGRACEIEASNEGGFAITDSTISARVTR
jgi:hypothetical protein